MHSPSSATASSPARAAIAAIAALLGLAGCGKGPGMTPDTHPLCMLYAGASDDSDPPGPIAGFVEGARAAGIDFQGGVDPETREYSYLDFMGSGVCMIDYDGDGKLDLFFPNRSGQSPCDGPAPKNRLFKNLGGHKFMEVTADAGLDDGGTGVGCAVGDIDGDGDPDLYVSDNARGHLWENHNGFFVDITDDAGIVGSKFVDMSVWQTSAAFADFDGDGKLDLYVGQFNQPYWMGQAFSDLLFMNQGNNKFVEVGQKVGLALEKPHPSLVNLAFDFNHDGLTDIYVGNDGGPSQLFINHGAGTFLEQSSQHGLLNDGTDGARSATIMGITVEDLRGDGGMQMIGSDLAAYPDKLYECDAGGHCVSADAGAWGLASTTPDFKWAVSTVDFDDDGRPDLFETNGQPVPEDLQDRYVPSIVPGPFNQRVRLFLNAGGKFSELVPGDGDGMRTMNSGRGLAVGDLDDDGDVDVVVSSYGGRPLLLWNQLSAPDGASWGHGAGVRPLNVRLVGMRSNPDGIGARVTVTAGTLAITRERTGGGPFLSASDPRVHFGLGSHAHVDRVHVKWPAGDESDVTDVPDDALTITIKEGG